MKDFLAFENQRNKRNARLYSDIMRAAFGDCEVLIGHHLTFELNGDLATENEIPSADTLMFDHKIMKKVFGIEAKRVMASLASVPVERRDVLLQREFEGVRSLNKAAVA